ncbi:hypothetical protein B0H16DRAFT_1859941, partial [Mycena metata]
PIRTHHWDRVLCYARRVKTVLVHEPDSHGPWLEAVQLLNISFPNLRSLKWNTKEPLAALFPYIRMSLPPSLRLVTLHLQSSAASQLSVLSYLSTGLPYLANLKYLAFVNIRRPYRVSSSRAFDQQMAAKGTALPPAYAQLASFSSLKCLNVGKLDGCPPLSATDSPSFQSLARLTVWGSTTQLIKNFLQWCERTPVTLLEECRFYCNVPTTGGVVYDLIVALGSDDMLAILSPLSVSFDNGFIAAMSIAWPKIKTLRFRVSSIDTRRGSVALSALSAFALRYPRLEYLQLEFDATTVPHGRHPPSQAPRVRQTQLASLDVMNSAIEAPAIVAHYLSAIFPGLQCIETDRVDGLTDEEEEELRQAGRSTLHTWMKVGKLVPLLAAARSEEETFWMAQAQTPGEAAP